MKVWNVYDDELRAIALEVGLRIRGGGPKREGRAYRFRLALNSRLEVLSGNHHGRYRFQKLDQWRVGTSHVCWHGQRAFLHALFQQFPDAIVDTAFHRYYGLESFERLYRGTKGASIPGYVNNQSECTCPTGVKQRRLWRPTPAQQTEIADRVRSWNTYSTTNHSITISPNITTYEEN